MRKFKNCQNFDLEGYRVCTKKSVSLNGVRVKVQSKVIFESNQYQQMKYPSTLILT